MRYYILKYPEETSLITDNLLGGWHGTEIDPLQDLWFVGVLFNSVNHLNAFDDLLEARGVDLEERKLPDVYAIKPIHNKTKDLLDSVSPAFKHNIPARKLHPNENLVLPQTPYPKEVLSVLDTVEKIHRVYHCLELLPKHLL